MLGPNLVSLGFIILGLSALPNAIWWIRLKRGTPMTRQETKRYMAIAMVMGASGFALTMIGVLVTPWPS